VASSAIARATGTEAVAADRHRRARKLAGQPLAHRHGAPAQRLQRERRCPVAVDAIDDAMAEARRHSVDRDARLGGARHHRGRCLHPRPRLRGDDHRRAAARNPGHRLRSEHGAVKQHIPVHRRDDTDRRRAVGGRLRD
jgi:hypothetical protein